MADTVIMTHEGVREIEEKLDFLKTVKRAECAEQIKIARAFGDLSENAEYDEAKNEQARVEAEISKLEAMIKNAEVVDTKKVKSSSVAVGTKVRVLDIEMDSEEEYYLVGSAEADVSKNKISNESPVGRAIIGHKAGETVSVEAPGGTVPMKIISISKAK